MNATISNVLDAGDACCRCVAAKATTDSVLDAGGDRIAGLVHMVGVDAIQAL